MRDEWVGRGCPGKAGVVVVWRGNKRRRQLFPLIDKVFLPEKLAPLGVGGGVKRVGAPLNLSPV